MPTRGAPLTVCGKPLSPGDRKVWQQAIALLMGLKVRNGFGKKDLAGAVERALHRGVQIYRCEDCRVKVGSGAAHPQGLRARGFLNPPWPPIRTRDLL